MESCKRSLVYDQHSGGLASFGNQNIKCSARGGRIHNLKADTAPGHCKGQVPMRKDGLPTRAEDQHIRIQRQDILQIVDVEVVDANLGPVAEHGFGRDRDRVIEVLVANVNSATIDVSNGDGGYGVACKLQSFSCR